MQFWLTESGYPENPEHTALDITAGIGGLRADFAQGLPPQAWEYIINRTRSRKWDFVFMAESLDGGAVTYRSNRHFDVLNENLIYAFHSATKAGDFQSLYNPGRRFAAIAASLCPGLLYFALSGQRHIIDSFASNLRFEWSFPVQFPSSRILP